jgi:hypothetical protein
VDVKLHAFLTPTLNEGVRAGSHYLYSWEKIHGYPLERRVGGPQSWSGPQLHQRIKPHAPRLWPVTILTELFQYKTLKCENDVSRFNP